MANDDLKAGLPHSEPNGPTNGQPAELLALLRASGDAERNRAWAGFVRRYSRLMLHAVHQRSNGYDDAMDRYAFVLESLSDSDFKRLRQYDVRSAARFTTWLVVVTNRLCVDFHRTRYGTYGTSRNGDRHREFRRRLVDLVSVQLDLESVTDARAPKPDADIRRAELMDALGACVGDLEPRDRWLLRLRFHDGLAAREIAALMDFPTLFHVYRRVNAVLVMLRDSLESRGVSDAKP